MVTNASNGATVQQSFAPVLEAMLAMRQGNAERKVAAHEYLEHFQKSAEAWEVTVGILQSTAEPEAKLFAATTLRGKITYDAHQLPDGALVHLREQVLDLLKASAAGPRPIRTQLCVCLAILAVQLKAWKDVVPSVAAALKDAPGGHSTILHFLKVLPEEVTEGRNINLTEDELRQRTGELLGDNAAMIVQLLVNYTQQSDASNMDPLLLEVITSWLREVPLEDVVKSPLLDVIFRCIDVETTFDAAVECLCAIFHETRDVDDSTASIQILMPKLLALRPQILAKSEAEDEDAFKGITRIFAEAGEAWVILVAREPEAFRPLVDALLDCARLDPDRNAIAVTFAFWYELKLYLVLDIYITARLQYVDIYAKLVDVMMKQLQYPIPDSPNSLDLFDGDREAEEKFRSFRHDIGDVLKDCCDVMGVTQCLTKVLDRMKLWMTTYGGQASGDVVPQWQLLEAPIFSMRAMGRMVDKEENIILPQILPLIVQIPAHEKLRFAAIMTLGRYTEWTANHPEFLEPQFTYIVSSFRTDSKEVIRAAAMAMKFFCNDCKHLLSGQVMQLQQFYEQTLNDLQGPSQEELTEGVANVVAVQPPAQTYDLLKLYCDPLMKKLMAMAESAVDKPSKFAVADHLLLISQFIQIVQPYFEPGSENLAVKYMQEVFPILSTLLTNFIDFPPISERVCRCLRSMVISYRTDIAPLLPALADVLASSFATSRQGCFLWVTSAILREFSEDREHVNDDTSLAIYAFFETQAVAVLRTMSDLPPRDVPDVIEDFYRLMIDALLYYPHRLIFSPLCAPILEAAVSALALEQREPLSAALHYLRDFVGYGGENPPSSSKDPNPPAVRQGVQQLLQAHGEALVKQIFAGMMITFPSDCFMDGSGVLLALLELLPQETATWIEKTIRMLPPGTVKPEECDRLMHSIRDKLAPGRDEFRKVRSLLQDFTNTYRRRYVAPRDGLGGLAARRFSFSG